MKNIGILLLILTIVFVSGCDVLGGPSSIGYINPTSTPLRWYPAAATFTPMPSLTGAPQIPITGNYDLPPISVAVATNCRTGPSADYNIVLAFLPGQTALIIGKYTPANYWVIQTMNGYTCWLWGQYASIDGDTSSIPDYPVPPLPTPTHTPMLVKPAPDSGTPMTSSTPSPQSDPSHHHGPPHQKNSFSSGNGSSLQMLTAVERSAAGSWTWTNVKPLLYDIMPPV